MILNLHALTSQSRMTNIQHSLFLSRHITKEKIESANLLLIDALDFTKKEYELGIINYEIIAYRSSPLWPIISKKLELLLKSCRKKILIVQDDYTHNSKLKSFISNQRIDYVYSSVKNDLNKLYSQINLKTEIIHLPTGLFEPTDLVIYENLRKPLEQRIPGIHASYRILPRYFGSTARSKNDLVIKWENYIQKYGVSQFRIETGQNLFGINWLAKLAKYKFALHHKGGAGLIDRYGELRFLDLISRKNSHLNYLIFRNLEKKQTRNGNFSASGPRLVESILLKCVLLAPKDEYELNLKAGIDFLEIVPNDPKSSIANCLERSDMELLQICDSALKSLLDSKEFNYCERAKEILSLSELSINEYHHQSLNHTADSVTKLIETTSNFQKEFLNQEKVLKLTNKYLSNIVAKSKLNNTDRLFLDVLDKSKIHIDSNISSLIYLNLVNGIPLIT